MVNNVNSNVCLVKTKISFAKLLHLWYTTINKFVKVKIWTLKNSLMKN